MPVRIEKEILYLRRDFTDAEKLQMGSELGQAYNDLAVIDEQKKTSSKQLAEKEATVNAKISGLSRNLNQGWDMANVPCTLRYDSPNVGEVEYVDPTGKVVKTRAMTAMENQLELDLADKAPTTAEEEKKSVEKSAEAAKDFFGGDGTQNAEAPSEGKAPAPAKTNGEVVVMPPATEGKKKGKNPPKLSDTF